jgi:hypothetical protein
MARVTGLEPATSGVTGRHSNQLSYTRAFPKTPEGKPAAVSARLGASPARVKQTPPYFLRLFFPAQDTCARGMKRIDTRAWKGD